MAKIVLTGGGTAGHCIPHIALLPYLQNSFDEIFYIGSCNGIEKGIIEKNEIPYFSVACAKFNRSFTCKNFTIPFSLIKGIKQAKTILKDVKPDVIFSKGGYVALPTVIAGKQLKIPVISHESDFTVGLANKITARFSKTMLTAFPETANTVKNGKYVGAPIRKNLMTSDREFAYKRFGLDGKKPVLLILGGSSGSVKLNDTTRNALPSLLEWFDVLHICGRNNVINSISKTGYVQIDYCFDIENAFAITDVAVSRAGSNAVFEILSLKIPTVFIPLPKGVSRGDQILNAEYFLKKNVCALLYQEDLSPKSLVKTIKETYKNRFKLKEEMKKSPVKNASKDIAEILINEIKQPH